MFAKVLIDNIAEDGFLGEWGLSVYIEHEGHKLLLDTGTTGKFAENAEKMGIDLSEVECGVLSHAHFDHSDGMAEFFRINANAKFYLREEAGENCYKKAFPFPKYIGIRKGTLKAYSERICYVTGDYELFPNIYLIPHKASDLEKRGKEAKMLVKNGLRFKTDSFSHEQSLVIRTEKGLAVFNSCSHGGADTILQEVSDTFPNESIIALIGGFHLFESSKEQVAAMAKGIRQTQVEKLITGHCTGQQAYQWLREELGDKVEQIRTGLEIRI